MLYTQADLDAVTAAIRSLLANGVVKKYKVGDLEIERSTLKELRELRAEIQREVEIDTDPNAGTSYASFGGPV